MGITGTLVDMIKAMYENIMTRVKLFDGTESCPFEILSGLKQGCALSCMLFNAVIDSILRITMNDKCPGVSMAWRIPKGRKHRGDTVEGVETIGTCLYADDIAQWCEEPQELQLAASVLAETLDNWGMRINALFSAKRDGMSSCPRHLHQGI